MSKYIKEVLIALATTNWQTEADGYGGDTLLGVEEKVDESLLEIKLIIAEARPSGHSEALDEYYKNLLKALGDVYKDTDEESCYYCKMKGREYTPECELNK